MLDLRVAQTAVENVFRDAILYALGKRLPAVADLAALRAVATRGEASSERSDEDLIKVAGVPAAYRWSSVSDEADDDDAVVKPDDVDTSENGRWLRWETPLRIALTPGADSVFLHEIESGPVVRVLLLDKSMLPEEINGLITGQVPSVVIEATDDDPEDADQDVGFRWFTEYGFNVSIVAENLRDRREAAQGSSVSGETTPGANAIDGLIQALLVGTQLSQLIDGDGEAGSIRAIRAGRGFNWVSELAQRRIIRQRAYRVQATVVNPAAPNDAGPAEEVDAQAELIELHGASAFDPKNYLDAPGFEVAESAGLVKPVAAGTAVIAGQAVIYIGELHTFTADRDTYRDLLPGGSLAFIEVTVQGEEPPVTATALRVGVTRTDGSGVVEDRLLGPTKAAYGPTNEFPLS